MHSYDFYMCILLFTYVLKFKVNLFKKMSCFPDKAFHWNDESKSDLQLIYHSVSTINSFSGLPQWNKILGIWPAFHFIFSWLINNLVRVFEDISLGTVELRKRNMMLQTLRRNHTDDEKQKEKTSDCHRDEDPEINTCTEIMELMMKMWRYWTLVV